MDTVTAEPRVEELIESIKAARKRSMAAKINRWKRNNPILSDISDCDRQITYGVLNWEEKPLHDEELQARFEEGKEQERKVVTELQDLGFDVILSQQPVVVTGRNGITLATGKIDGFIKWSARRFPLEVKSMNPNIFSQIDTVDDLMKKAWLRKYVRQLMMYLYGNNEEMGLFIITDCLGHWKLLPLFLDYGECELILQRLEKIHAHILAKTYPDRISYSREMCGRCPFATTCLPDIINSGIEFIDMPDLVEKRKRMDAIEHYADEWLELDKDTKDVAKQVGQDFIAGQDYKVEIKRIPGTRIDTKKIPIEERAKYEVSSETVRVAFVPLKPQ